MYAYQYEARHLQGFSFAQPETWKYFFAGVAGKCAFLPFYNGYFAEKGFKSNLHNDRDHMSFSASMCEGRKLWRVINNKNLTVLHRELIKAEMLSPRGSVVNVSGLGEGSFVNGDVLQPFDSWTDSSWLHTASSDLVVYEGILSPGEVIHIPAGAIHAAHTLDDSFMVASNAHTIRSKQEWTAYRSM